MIFLSEWSKGRVKNHLYESKEGYLVLCTYGKHECRIKLDLEMKDYIQNFVWSARCTSNNVYYPFSLGKRISLIKYVYNCLNGQDINTNILVLLKNHDESNLNYDIRLSNLTTNYKETYKKDVKLKKFKKNFETSREKILVGLKNNRYDNNYSLKLRESKLGTNNTCSKLNEDIVREIRRLADEGYTHSVISEKFNIYRTTVGDIVNYRIWNDYLMNSDDVKHIKFFEPTEINFNKSLENIRLNLNLFENGKGFIDTYSGIKYLTATKEKQLYIEALENDKFIYSFTLRLMPISVKTKWKNYGIILMVGDKSKLPSRENLYKIYEALAMSLLN